MKRKAWFNAVGELIAETTSKTFHEYWKEMRRHEKRLREIYAKDKLHKCVPEEMGSINQVLPKQRLLVTFRRCGLCMKDLPPIKARK